MRFIVTRDILRTRELQDLKICGGCKGAAEFDDKTGESKIHKDHIHRGAIVDLGRNEDMKELRANWQRDPQWEWIIRLLTLGIIRDAADTKTVERIEAEIIEDKKRRDRTAQNIAKLQNATIA